MTIQCEMSTEYNKSFTVLLLTVDLTAPFSIVFFRTRVEELVTPFAQVRVFFPYSRDNANSNG